MTKTIGALETAEPGLTLPGRPDHLDFLEAHAVFVLREVAAECERPVLVFSGGEDSAVLLRLAEKAFRPGRFPFPVLHVDTGHDFDEVLEFRDTRIAELGEQLIVAAVQDAIDSGRVPDPGAGRSRHRLRGTTLLDAIAEHGFDACISGARGDGDSARNTDRILSGRGSFGQWDPPHLRSQPWPRSPGTVRTGAHLRACPLSDWTELDIWQYLRREGIGLPELSFARRRPVLERDGVLLPVGPWVTPGVGETVEVATVRIRTVGDATGTGVVRSAAGTVDEVIAEVGAAARRERGTDRADDGVSPVAGAGARLPVQWVVRHPGGGRSYAGMVSGGSLHPGDEVVVLPGGRRSRVASVETFDGPLDGASASMSVTVRLDDEIDVSRGDLIAPVRGAPVPLREFEATVRWLVDQPLVAGRRLRVKHTTRVAPALVLSIVGRLAPGSLDLEATDALGPDDVGVARLAVGTRLAVDHYSSNRVTGSFVLIDERTNATVAEGMVGEGMVGAPLLATATRG